MTDEVFSFTPEQKDKLMKWKTFLDSEQSKQWSVDEKEGIDSIHLLLEQSGFKEGNDLSEGQLDDLFHNVRKLINNRAIARNLYDNNGISNFNSRLRELYFGKEPLVKRVDQFIELKGIGVPTVSQFLCALDPKEYPEVTTQTLGVLGLDSGQLESAYKQALIEHSISSASDYYNVTLEYLGNAIIFREIKNILDVDLYNSVNNILWFAYVREVSQDESEMKPSTTTVSLELDLRDRLADNPNLIEKDLSLIGKDYPISSAGKADVVCKDKRGNYVVIETKKGRESDKVVGQILRYIGGLKKEGKRTRGIIIVNEPDEKLDFAIEAVRDFVKLKYYKVKFEITDTYIKD